MWFARHAKCVVTVIFLCFIVNTNVDALRQSDDESYSLSLLLSKLGKKPILYLVQQPSGTKSRTIEFPSPDYEDTEAFAYDYYNEREDYDDNVDSNEYNIEFTLNRVLKHVKPSSGSRSSERLDVTKHVLRSALRSRCRQVESCVRKCPPKKPSCPKTCQQVYDDLNLCEPVTTPDPCQNKPKCGRTMPPKWRL